MGVEASKAAGVGTGLQFGGPEAADGDGTETRHAVNVTCQTGSRNGLRPAPIRGGGTIRDSGYDEAPAGAAGRGEVGDVHRRVTW
jgi:hypothetical protein